MKKLLITLAFAAAFIAPASAQSAIQIARQWNDSLIRPKRPIAALEQHALDSVMLNAVAAASSGTADVDSYLRALPGYGEGKVLTIVSGAFQWVTGTVGALVTYLTTADGYYLTTADGEILTPTP